jgi:phosphatidylserine/phosphatidylglycerophosphate/cardiolipin synthase-like enzyme
MKYRHLMLGLVITAMLAGVHVKDNLRQLLFPSGSVAASTSGLELHYSPADNLEHVDIDLIQRCRGHLDIAMYAFTDQAIARAILNAANQGVQVRIYRDRGQYEQEQRNPYIATLFRSSSNIHIRVKNSHELMHLKSWSDGTVLREGSSNWSPSGEKRQQNSLLIIRDSNLIRTFETTFDSLWNQPGNYVVQ